MQEGGAPTRRPRVQFDHVQIAVADLDEAAEILAREHGLTALPGGRHPGRGTANAIVPLGDAYLELIAVVDTAEAARLPTSMRVARAVESGRSFAVWVVRTDDLDATRAHLQRQGFDLPDVGHGARRRPDGGELTWRMQELVHDAAPSPLPFLIEWRVAPADYPGAADVTHPCGAIGMAAVTLSDPDPLAARSRLRTVLGEDVEHDVVPGAPGVIAVALDTPNGRLILR